MLPLPQPPPIPCLPPPNSGETRACPTSSALLNPKNALFYATLTAMLDGPAASTQVKLFYAGWMFSVVLLWDLLVAAMTGHRLVLQRFARALPWLERGTGVLLIVLAVPIVLSIGLGCGIGQPASAASPRATAQPVLKHLIAEVIDLTGRASAPVRPRRSMQSAASAGTAGR